MLGYIEATGDMSDADATKKCGWCRKFFTVLAIGINPKTNKLHATCVVCRPKYVAMKKNYKESGKQEAAYKRYYDSERGQRVIASYNNSDHGKQVRTEWRNGELGKAARQKTSAARIQRYHDDSSFRMQELIHTAATQLCNGHRMTSPKFEERTGWDARAFRAHLERQFSAGMTWANHGDENDPNGWDIEHGVPQEAFLFPDEAKKCWHPSNVRPLRIMENKKKGVKLLDECFHALAVEAWPNRWPGRIPTEEERQAFYSEHTRGMHAHLPGVWDA
jgi:hypothetical protein